MKTESMGTKLYVHIRGDAVVSIQEPKNEKYGGKIDRNQVIYHPMLEGSIDHKGRDVLFCLKHVTMGPQSREEIGNILRRVSIDVLAGFEDQFEKDNNYFMSSQDLFKKYGVSEKILGTLENATSKALFDEFGKNALVLVPGYVSSIGFNDFGALESEVEIIPEQDRPKIETKFRVRGLEGQVYFWNH